MKLASTATLFIHLTAAVAGSAWAQVNVGEHKPEATLPFTMTTTSEFSLPWRIAFLPDGRMLVTEKVGPVWLVSAEGKKIGPLGNTPAVYWQGQNGMHGVFVSPRYATDQSIYLTYAEPGDYGGGLALARGKLVFTAAGARLDNFEVLWRQLPRGRGGQEGAQVAFSPDDQYLFLSVGDRQRFSPAQDLDQPAGKILRLTLDGKPAPGNPFAGRVGATSIPLIDPPPRHGGGEDGAAGQHVHVQGSEPHAGRNLGNRRSHALWAGVLARRRAVGSRAWSARRRRAELDREGQELRLAARLVRHQLQRHADPEPRHEQRVHEARPVVGAGHRARQSDVLHERQDVPAVAG